MAKIYSKYLRLFSLGPLCLSVHSVMKEGADLGPGGHDIKMGRVANSIQGTLPLSRQNSITLFRQKLDDNIYTHIICSTRLHMTLAVGGTLNTNTTTTLFARSFGPRED